jgi:hypothetical protein
MTVGLARSGFDIDLAEGKLREGVLRKALAANGRLIELKSDKRYKETGNLFVEYRQKGRPSGIAVTECQWWATEFLPDRFIIVPYAVMLDRAMRAHLEGRTVKGGDNNLYDGVKVPLHWLLT